MSRSYTPVGLHPYIYPYIYLSTIHLSTYPSIYHPSTAFSPSLFLSLFPSSLLPFCSPFSLFPSVSPFPYTHARIHIHMHSFIILIISLPFRHHGRWFRKYLTQYGDEASGHFLYDVYHPPCLVARSGNQGGGWFGWVVWMGGLDGW
ncbi:uncharacterized protein IWZ02DRAFT_460834 [Phyllosticta citriasiana]|uniref:uncharacterized protein n=1 Tax=Phyllosticta citriasiana TaxID=595635 RepID=UPI0030FDDC27